MNRREPILKRASSQHLKEEKFWCGFQTPRNSRALHERLKTLDSLKLHFQNANTVVKIVLEELWESFPDLFHGNVST